MEGEGRAAGQGGEVVELEELSRRQRREQEQQQELLLLLSLHLM